MENYENINTAAKPSHRVIYDPDTSEEEEVEVNYSQVKFKPKPGRQRAHRDSSSTEEEETTKYSEVKIWKKGTAVHVQIICIILKSA